MRTGVVVVEGEVVRVRGGSVGGMRRDVCVYVCVSECVCMYVFLT